jgi:hypothetical protein
VTGPVGSQSLGGLEMQKIVFGLMGISLLLALALGFWSCSKPASPAPDYSISVAMTGNNCDSVFILDGGQPITITAASYSATLYNNVTPGNHTLILNAGSNSVTCSEDVEITHYVLQVSAPCPPNSLTCASVLPE